MGDQEAAVDLADFQSSSGFFTGAKLQCPTICTATGKEPCHIVGELAVWNEFLCQACIELREDAPGELCLVFRDYYNFVSNGEKQIHKAFILVHFLVEMHRCVAGLHIRNYFFDLSSFQDYISFGSNVYNSMKSLRLRDVKAALLLQNISMAIPNLAKLEELEIAQSKVSDGFIQAVCSLITTSSFLKHLSLPNYDMNWWEADALYNALAENSILEELCVNTSSLLPCTVHCCVNFARYMETSATLRTLEVYSTRYRTSRILAPLARALARSRTLMNITLYSLFVDLEGAHAIEKFLSKNTMVKSFNLRKCRWHGKHGLYPAYENTKYDTNDMGSLSKRIQPWISILRKNRSLQELTLNLCAFSPTECNTLFFELIKSPTIKKITIEDIAFYCSRRGHRNTNPSAIQEGRSYIRDRPDRIVAECKQLADLDLAVYEVDDCTWFTTTVLALAGCRHVTKLSLDLRLVFQDGIVPLVCEYIKQTLALRELRLWLPWFRLPYCQDASIHRMTIIRALEQNSSVRKLTLQDHCSKEEVAFLANIIQSSKVIHTFILGSFPEPVETFLQHLSTNLSQNHTLVSLEFYTPGLRVTRSFFVVKDIVRRNHDLITCAAHFVIGKRSRRCCEALESVAGNPALVEKLCKMSSLEEAKAAQRVCESLNEIRGFVDYMRFAGVVESRLDFYEKPYDRPWLDDIDEYSWLSVRRYLRVADVLQAGN